MRLISRFALLLCATSGALLPLRSTRTKINWSGAQCVLSGTFTDDLTVTSIEFDVDGDGVAEVTRHLDKDRRYFAALPAKLLEHGQVTLTARNANGDVVTVETLDLEQDADLSLANALAQPAPTNIPASLCSCNQSGVASNINGTSALTVSREAGALGVSLVDGAVVTPLPVFEFMSVGHNISFELYHHSLTTYAGPVGNSFSHSYNTFIVQDDATHGRIVTPDLRVFPITQGVGGEWVLPQGFFAKLVRDTNRGMWVLTNHSGQTYEFFLGVDNLPGHLIGIADTNGNRITLGYDASGRLATLATPAAQRIAFGYDDTGLLTSVADHIGRRWTLAYRDNRLVSITSPSTEATNLRVGASTLPDEIVDTLVQQRLSVTLEYADRAFPDHLTAVRNGASDAVLELRYDGTGRVSARGLGGATATFLYDDALFAADGTPNGAQVPVARRKLDPGNVTARVIDRVGNVMDVEMHGAAGGPIGGAGKFGVRRVLQWTERGAGRTPLRTDEPNWWEKRWLHDSDSLTAKQVSDAYRSDASVTYDVMQMPTNVANEYFTYNQWRQVTDYVHADATSSVRWQRTYQGFDPAAGEFSRVLSATPQRAFTSSPLDSGLSFKSLYEYDLQGNLTLIRHPVVTRGQATPQTTTETFVRNSRGQILAYENADGDVTLFDYFTTSQASSDINFQGAWAGYVHSITRGATGSRRTATNRKESFAVNNLGMVTAITDPAAQVWSVRYTTLGQVSQETTPPVQLGSVSTPVARVYAYDQTGQRVLERHQNIDHQGAARANPWIDTVFGRDTRGNVLSVRHEADANSGNDTLTRFAYDANDQAIAVMEPMGNRMLRSYDERRLPLREFLGVAAPTNGDPAQGYPARSVATPSFGYLSSNERKFDANARLIASKDGRGNVTTHYRDFLGREIATSDANGNGTSVTYDAAGNPITIASGVVGSNGQLTTTLQRSYRRYDERNRGYLDVRDALLATNEDNIVNPAEAGSVRTAITLSGVSQVTQSVNPRGQTRSYAFNASGNTTVETDAVGNKREWTYDALGQMIEMRAHQVDGLSPTTLVTSVGQVAYDALGRVSKVAFLGQGGSVQGNANLYAYDSVGFLRTMTDAEGFVTERERDDLMRVILQRQRNGAGVETSRTMRSWDANSRLIAESDLMDLNNPALVQTRRYAWDALDRQIRRTDPDSDDPIDGSTLGADGTWDRIEWTWDANSNITAMKDERGSVKGATYDAANRMTATTVSGIGGITRERYTYDALGQALEKANDVSRIARTYDALGRIAQEIQSVRLDGTGFTRGWIEPVTLAMTRDLEGNIEQWSVRTGAATDLAVTNTFDPLNRLKTTAASYMNGSRSHQVASFIYEGFDRNRRITYGNGAQWNTGFDAMGRTRSAVWTTASGQQIAGFEYDFDKVNNPLWERTLHDGSRYDNFGYGASHQLVGVQYRSAQSADYRTQAPTYSSTFSYDDRSNREQSSEVDPFGGATLGGNTSYQTNIANQYSSISRGAATTTLQFDRFGSAVRLPVYPRTGAQAGTTSVAQATYDIHAQLSTLTVNGTVTRYAYDVERRRIATFTIAANNTIVSGDRLIYLGQHEVAERRLAARAVYGDATSKHRRIYVWGNRTDHLLFSAVDGNADGRIGTINGNPYAASGSATNDYAYYVMQGTAGSTAALVHADDATRVLEYYEHTPFGEATVLPIVDVNNDTREDTPTDLADNYQRMLTLRVSLNDASVGRFSRVGNAYTFAGRRLDPESGHVHMRLRQYDPVLGRFTSRDWAEEMSLARHPFAYGLNQPGSYTDPYGLAEWSFEYSVELGAPIDCPEELNATIKGKVSGSAEFESPPIIWGITVTVSIEGELEGSAKAIVCTKPKCLQVLGPMSLSGSLTLSVSAGVGIGDWARVEVGVRGTASGSATYDLCAGKGTLEGEVSGEVFARVTVDTWWLEFEAEASVSIGSMDFSKEISGAKLDCQACPCCEDPVITIPDITMVIPVGENPGITTTGDIANGFVTFAGTASVLMPLTSTQGHRELGAAWDLLCATCCQER